MEIGLERHGADDHLPVDQRFDPLKNARMNGREEMFGLNLLAYLLDQPIIDQHRAQRSRFCFQIGWQRAATRRVWSGGGFGIGTGQSVMIGHRLLLR